MLVNILVIITILILVVGFYLIYKKLSENKKDDTGLIMLQNQLQELIKQNQELKISNEELKREVGEKLHTEMSKTQNLVSNSVETQFKESQKIILEMMKQLEEVKRETGKVGSFAEQLQNLQDILQNSKQRGALGEYFLEQTIRNILPPENYEFQYSFKDGTIVDAVIKLPDGMVPVDSKFSLENYNKIVEEKDEEKRKILEKKFKEDLKKRILETSKYIKPKEGTMDFAFMFIPSEGIYYDLLISKIGVVDSRNFLEYAFRDKKVIIVSPSTLYAYLQTVMQGLKSLKIEKKAGEIIKRVDVLGSHLKKFKVYHEKLGKNIATVVNHYNFSQKEFGKIDKDILKITGVKDKPEEVYLIEEKVDSDE